MTDDLSHSWQEHWDYATPLYLNHGSFGLTPKAIVALEAELLAQIHRDCDNHFWFDGIEQMEQARLAVAAFVKAPADDLILVDHVTEAINSVLKSLTFAPGDEVIVLSHGYPPYKFLYEEFCRRTGVKLVVTDIPFPVAGPDDATAAITACVTDRTKLAIVDHITSPTGLVLPIAEIVAVLKEQGVETFVDGAHCIGHIPLDVPSIGAAYYTSNQHKWLSAPLESGFLYVRPDCQHNIVPAVGSINSGTDHKFTERFAWQGAKNPVSRLCIPETIRYIGALHPNGWDGIYRRNHELALAARDLLCDRLGLTPACPDEMTPCMFSLELGPLTLGAASEDLPPHKRVNKLVRERFGYGLLCVPWGEQYLMRLTAYLYNSLADYERLADDLAQLLPELQCEKVCAHG